MFPDFRQLQVYDPTLGLLLATVIKNIRVEGGELASRRIIGEASGLSVRSVMFPYSPLHPQAFVCQMSDAILVAIDGANLPSQIAGLVRAYDPNFFEAVTDQINGYVRVASQALRDFMTANGFPRNLPTVYGGWSLGGAIANFRVWSDQDDLAPSFRKCVTFGAPMVGGATFYRQNLSLNLARYMNARDWIPLTPSRLGVTFFSTPFVPLRRVRSYQSFGQAINGYVLDDDGSMVGMQYTTQATVPSMSSLQAAIVVGNPPTEEHSIDLYANRLAHVIQNRVVPQPAISEGAEPNQPSFPAPIPAGPSVEPQPQPHRMVEQQRAVMDVAIRNQGIRQDVPQVVIPTERQFSASRIGRDWVIVFGGEVVGVGPTKRRARAMAREGNAMLRSVSRQAFVDTTALAQLFGEYLDDAAQPNAGFVPPIADALPVV